MKDNSREKKYSCAEQREKRYFYKASPTFQVCCSSPELLLLAAICCLLNHGMTGNICLYGSQDQAFTISLAPFLSFFLFPSPPPHALPKKKKEEVKEKVKAHSKILKATQVRQQLFSLGLFQGTALGG